MDKKLYEKPAFIEEETMDEKERELEEIRKKLTPLLTGATKDYSSTMLKEAARGLYRLDPEDPIGEGHKLGLYDSTLEAGLAIEIDKLQRADEHTN